MMITGFGMMAASLRVPSRHGSYRCLKGAVPSGAGERPQRFAGAAFFTPPGDKGR
jgi:hypothetical protein